MRLHLRFPEPESCQFILDISVSEPFPPSLAELKETFEFLEDWDEKYEYLIELGKQLPGMPAAAQCEDNRVHGCMSSVWLVLEPENGEANQLKIVANSDSLIIKGLIVILTAAFSGKNRDEILLFDVDQVFREFGLHQHLSPNRRNGLFSMVQRIKQLAAEY